MSGRTIRFEAYLARHKDRRDRELFTGLANVLRAGNADSIREVAERGGSGLRLRRGGVGRRAAAGGAAEERATANAPAPALA